MSRIHITTPRLILRDLQESDCPGMHAMGTDPAVCAALGISCALDSTETLGHIRSVQAQYKSNGFGRYAMLDRESGSFLGWAGLKIENNVNGRASFIDLGYRMLPQYWGRGYATEASRALVSYGFDVLGVDTICAYVESSNPSSRRVAEKAGLRVTGTFDGERMKEWWLELKKKDY
ncbi:unnamed protein product, partial [Ectocarpus fasciculatus]